MIVLFLYYALRFAYVKCYFDFVILKYRFECLIRQLMHVLSIEINLLKEK